MGMDFKNWREKGDHLPDFMRDFHDQKDLFKAIEYYFTNSEDCPVNWRDGHVFTVDWFLWFMAAHGYTLQRTRKKCEFVNLDQTKQAAKEALHKSFQAILTSNDGS